MLIKCCFSTYFRKSKMDTMFKHMKNNFLMRFLEVKIDRTLTNGTPLKNALNTAEDLE